MVFKKYWKGMVRRKWFLKNVWKGMIRVFFFLMCKIKIWGSQKKKRERVKKNKSMFACEKSFSLLEKISQK